MFGFLHRCFNGLRVHFYYKTTMPYIKKNLAACGDDVVISEGNKIAGSGNITLGNHVYIGPDSVIYSTDAKLTIGDYFVAGPRLAIVTGDHRTDVIGEYMYNVHEKLPENDKDVVIEEDVWAGINVTILKGVTIGRGSVIAAGAVVYVDVPPYSVYISKDKILKRFSDEEIVRHESLLKQKYGKADTSNLHKLF